MMRTLLAAVALLPLLTGAAAAQKMCDQVRTNITTAPTPITEKVAGKPNQRIYLCGYMIVRSGVGGQDLQFELSSSTGTNCALNRAVILPKMNLPASGVLVNRIAYVAGEKTPPGHAMCLEVFGSGAGVVSTFYWAQF